LAHYRAGRLTEAEAGCRAQLKERPGDPDAVYLLGKTLLKAGNGSFAVPFLEQACAARDEDPDALVHLGRALHSSGEVVAALRAFDRALVLDDRFAAAHGYRGVALLDLGQAAEAVEALERVAQLEPEWPEAHYQLANALLEAGDRVRAQQSFEQALSLEPLYRDRHLKVGRELQYDGKLDGALRAYRWGLELLPSHPELEHMVAALEGQTGPVRASDAFVQHHFDAFADSFERVLERIEYSTPRMLVDSVQRALASGGRELDVLDAGCGTGLCGPLLRPLARRLVGVDLSPAMLEQAEARGLYDELRAEEITAALASAPGAYDVIVAADVLIYFGELGELLGAAAQALRPGALLGFSVERQAGPGWVLGPTGRYAHGIDYVRATTAQAGLAEIEISEHRMRLEQKKPVFGYVCVFRKP
jgi:predicted TPR repeat methyltransferase